MSDVLQDRLGAGVYLVSEANGYRSRGTGILLAGADYPAGAVLGQIAEGANAEKWALWNPANTDGSQDAAAILYAPTGASTSDRQVTLTLRDSEVNGNVLTYFTGASAAQIAAAAAQLATHGIVVRP